MKHVGYPALADYANRIRCDHHPQMGMSLVVIRGAAPTGELNDYAFSRCKFPMCPRHYSPQFGYFDTKEGDLLNVAVGEPRPRCDRHPETPAFFVENVDPDTWQYSCPVAGCENVGSYPLGNTLPGRG